MKVIGNLTKDAIIRAAVSEGQTLTQAIGTPVDVDTVQANISAATFDSSNNKVVIAYSNTDATHRGKVAVGTVDPSNNSISFGTPVTFFSDELESSYLGITFDSSNNKVVIAFRDITNGGSKAIVGTVSGTSISFGTAVSFTSNNTTMVTATFDSNSNKVVIVYKDQGNSGYGTAIVGTVSGTSISFGSATVFESATTNYPGVTFDSSNNKVVISYRDAGNSGIGTSIVGTVSGTSISFGSAATFNSENTTYTSITFDSTNNKIVVVAESGSNLKAFVGTVSGTSISFGSAVDVDTGSGIHNNVSFDSNTGKIAVIYQDQNNSNYPTLISGAVSGTSISFDTAVQIKASATVTNMGITFDSNSKKIVGSYRDDGGDDRCEAVVFQPAGSIATGGTIADGAPVIVNANGTVSSVSGTSNSQVLGTETVFESANTKDIAAAYDTTNDKVLIVFRDIGNYQYGTAIVGTVSGSSISFGSANVFESSATSYISVAFDSTAGKFLIAYRDEGDGSKGKAVVATISGTSVSYGSIAEFNSGNTVYTSTVYDSSNGKMVISYADFGNSSYGTAIVGTISGTSVSFGTEVVFESAATGWVNSVYDSNAQKVFIGYQDGGNSDYPTGIVGTVSGTSISFGSATATSSNGSNYLRVGFDSTNNKVVIAYRNESDSSKGYAVVGTISGTSVSFGTHVKFSGDEAVITESPNSISFDPTSGGILIAYEDTDRDATVIRGVISGTSISFDTPVILDTGGGSSHEYIGIVYDPDQDRHVVFYKDGAESSYGTAIVYSPAYSSSNLTTENFVGFMDGAALDGTNGEILSSCSIARNQTSLTPGQTYFVSPTDGALSLTAGDPSVTAGTAISSTELIVKG